MRAAGWTRFAWRSDVTSCDGLTSRRVMVWRHVMWRSDVTPCDGLTSCYVTVWRHVMWRSDVTSCDGLTSRRVTVWRHVMWRSDVTSCDGLTSRFTKRTPAIRHIHVNKNLSQCHFVHHKYHMVWLGTEPGPPRSEADNKRSDPWYGPRETLMWLARWLHNARAAGYSTVPQQT